MYVIWDTMKPRFLISNSQRHLVLYSIYFLCTLYFELHILFGTEIYVWYITPGHCDNKWCKSEIYSGYVSKWPNNFHVKLKLHFFQLKILRFIVCKIWQSLEKSPGIFPSFFFIRNKSERNNRLLRLFLLGKYD